MGFCLAIWVYAGVILSKYWRNIVLAHLILGMDLSAPSMDFQTLLFFPHSPLHPLVLPGRVLVLLLVLQSAQGVHHRFIGRVAFC